MTEEYRLGIVKGNNFDFRDTVPLSDYQSYDRYSKMLLKYSEERRLFKIVELNYHDFFQGTQSEFSGIDFMLPVEWQIMDEKILGVNRRLLNFLTSIRTFLDHNETSITKQFGKGSEQLEEFKRICSYFYDNSFAYRFFYKLRNYAQHCGMPIGEIKVSSQPDHEINRSRNDIILNFNRDELLKRYDSWGNPVKSEIQNQTEHFNVNLLVIEQMHNIKEIERNIRTFGFSKLEEAADFILDLTKHLRQEEGQVCILNYAESEEDKLTVHVENIPFHIIDEIKNQPTP